MGFAIACVVAALGTWGVVAVVRQLRRPETVDRDGRILLADTWTNRRDVVTGYHARVRLKRQGFRCHTQHGTMNGCPRFVLHMSTWIIPSGTRRTLCAAGGQRNSLSWCYLLTCPTSESSDSRGR